MAKTLRIPLDDTSLAQNELRKAKERRRRGFVGFTRREREQEVKKRSSGSRLRSQKK